MTTNTLVNYPHIINGKAAPSLSGETMNVVNPASGEVISTASLGGVEDVDTAVQAAKQAFANKAWRDMPPEERSKILYRCAHVVAENAAELISLEIACSGATITRASNMDIPAVVDLWMNLAESIKTYPLLDNLPPRLLPEQWHTQVIKEPIGVCGLITAWNFPLLLFSWKVGPALAAGNTMVVKPSELTPTSSIRLTELLQQVLPPGVLNIVNGTGPIVGNALCSHPDVDKISFTGSGNTGRHIQKTCADTFKRCTMELGGKGPSIVMADANLDMVAQGALFGVFMNAGQACESSTRLLVHESVYDELLEKLVNRTNDIVVGDPTNPSTSMGPMSTPEHCQKVLNYIKSGVDEGAKLLCGGREVQVQNLEGGHYIEPTIFVDVTNDMRIAREEIFGPVLSVIKFSSTEEALKIANDSNYGLSAGIWSGDLVNAQILARELRAGSIWINDWHMLRTDAPFGGYKQSGYGRELGRYSIDGYLETKTVNTSFERQPEKKIMHRLAYPTLGQ